MKKQCEKDDGAKTIQRLVPEKYKIQLGEAQTDLKGVDNSAHTLWAYGMGLFVSGGWI